MPLKIVDKMCVDEWTINKMSVDEMTMDKTEYSLKF